MSEQRITEYYKGFQVVAAYYKGEYQARGHHRFAEKISVRKCDSIDDALTRIKVLIDAEVRSNWENIRSGIIKNHKEWIKQKGKNYAGVRAITSFRRMNHCYSCKRPVDNAYDIECSACGWIICSNCGACGCGYMGGI